MTECNNDTGPAFSPLMVDRVTELCSLLHFANDLFCHPVSLTSNNLYSERTSSQLEKAVRVEAGGDSSSGSWSLALASAPPAVQGRPPRKPCPLPLSRADMLVAERFVWLRHLLAEVALPEHARYLRPHWQQDWVAQLRRHGLTESPATSAVLQGMVDATQRYRDFVKVRATESAAVLHVCGRPVYCTTVWSVKE